MNQIALIQFFTTCSNSIDQNICVYIFPSNHILQIKHNTMDKQFNQKPNKHIPKHYREHKYNQNKEGPISQEKQKKRQQRDEQHKQILQQYKKNHKYFDEEQNQLERNKYYSKLQNPHNYEQLHHLLSSTWQHAKRRQNIFPIVDRHPDYTLRCVYSGKILSDAEGNLLQKCDEEHSFPQSYQRGTKSGTGRDMHAIFAASKSANGSRGNTPFGLYSQEQKPIQVDECGVVYSGKPKKTYIPKVNEGAVARSTLANASYFPKQTLPWLIEQAAKQQVSLWEKHRNQELFRLQGNRNPFIDFPELAKCVDFSEGWQKEQK